MVLFVWTKSFMDKSLFILMNVFVKISDTLCGQDVWWYTMSVCRAYSTYSGPWHVIIECQLPNDIAVKTL